MPKLARVCRAFESHGYPEDAVTRIVPDATTLMVRTKVSSMPVLVAASLAKELGAYNLDVTFSRNGLVFRLYFS